MKKQIIISALATFITFSFSFFDSLSAQEVGETVTAMTAVPMNSGQSYVPWRGLKNNLERIRKTNPDNYAVPYYLGLVYLREGNRDAAIQEWESYLGMAPQDFKSVSVREQLTILILDQAAERAKQLVGQGSIKGPERPPVEDTLAVLDFKNLATPDFIPFIKALTMIIITDLTKVSQLVLVERFKVQALLNEMELRATGIIDPETAFKAGEFLLAKNITWGEVGTPQQGVVEITAKVGQTLSPSDPVEVRTKGPKENFFELEKQIVFGILGALGLEKEDLSQPVLQALEKYHTTNYLAFMSFGKGLDHLDHKDFAAAKAAFEQAAQADPDFGLSTTLEKSTPKVAITLTAVDNIGAFDVNEDMALEDEAGGEEDISVERIESMDQQIAVERDNITEDTTDFAQEQQEARERFGSIVVHW